MTEAAYREQVLRLIAGDRRRAHEILFKHRRSVASPAFHGEIIDALHGPSRRDVIEAFRGGGKSTLVEEAVVIKAVLGEFRNCLIVGASEDRAAERLEAIGHEFETNDDLISLFGVLQSSKIWGVQRKQLLSGVYMQARGAGQSMRGVKHLQWRPDLVIIDDLEDEETVKTPQARQQMLRWLYATLIPALADNAKIIFIGNRLDNEAVIVKVAKDPSWNHKRYPVIYLDEAGDEQSAWPSYFPLAKVYAIRAEFARQGLSDSFQQEYMCEAEAPEDKLFRPEHFSHIVRPRVRTWEATWAMVDPARSIGPRSATTAMPVWSWIGNRLIIWECEIGRWLPDEIIRRMIALDSLYRPVVLGVEEDALNQFILQPLRHARNGQGGALPIRPMAAKRYTQGRGKEDFIKGLQPFFAAREVEFAKPLDELQAQFLSFPRGQIDGPNALAYAIRMRPGGLMYDDYTQANILEGSALSPLVPLQLVVNANKTSVTAVLLQYDGRRLTVLNDWVEEGDPGQAVPAILRLVSLSVQGRPVRVTAPPQHFNQWNNVGLRAAFSRVPMDCAQGGVAETGRAELRHLLQLQVQGMPALRVGTEARWALNAFAGGYCRVLAPNGAVLDQPEENVYALLMQGLESFCAFLQIGAGVPGQEDGNMRRAADGRLYRSAMVDRRR